MEYFWLAVFGIFCAIEGATSKLVSIWFAAGAAVSMLAAVSGAGRLPQIVIFIVVSAFLFFSTRPVTRYLTKGRLPVEMHVKEIEGSKGIVISRIESGRNGLIRVYGDTWTARSDSDQTFRFGELVEVEKREGAVVIVKKLYRHKDSRFK